MGQESHVGDGGLRGRVGIVLRGAGGMFGSARPQDPWQATAATGATAQCRGPAEDPSEEPGSSGSVDPTLSTNGSLAQIRAYLNRSAEQPLSVTVIITQDSMHRMIPESSDVALPEIEECLAVLLKNSHRWRDCVLCSPTSSTMKTMLSLLQPCPFPALQFLQLSSSSYTSPDYRIDNIVLNAPNLSHYRSHTVPLPFSQARLTELKLGSFAVFHPAFADLITHLAPTLRRLTLVNGMVIAPGRVAGTESYPSLQFPHLTFLTISRVRDDLSYGPTHTPTNTLTGILLLGAASLETFICIGQDITELLYTGQVMLPRLRTLILRAAIGGWVAEDDLSNLWAALLRAFPAVEELDLSGYDTTQFLVYLVESQNSTAESPSAAPPAWPALRSITLKDDEWPSSPAIEGVRTFVDGCIRVGRSIPKLRLRVEEYHSVDKLGNVLKPPGVMARRHDQLPLDQRDLFSTWNHRLNVPAYRPWNGSLSFYDQFSSSVGLALCP